MLSECPGVRQLWLQGREEPREEGEVGRETMRKTLGESLKSGSSTDPEGEIKMTASP